MAVRHRCNLNVICHAIGDDPRGPLDGTIYDISTTGIGIILPEALERGSILLMELAVPDGDAPESISACVIHARPQDGGGFFTGCILAEQLREDEVEALVSGGEV